MVIGLASMYVGTGLASADPSGGTPVTVQVVGGTLDISVPVGPVDLGTVTASMNAQTVTASLGTVTVTDNRGDTTGWIVTAGGTNFVGPQDISASTVNGSGYTAGTATVAGTASVADTNLNSLYPTAAVQTATGVSGSNSASWNPTISVTIPAYALAGSYGTTITHSVS